MGLWRSIRKNAALLTVSSLVMQSLSMLWQVWLAAHIGPAGIGLFQLIGSVFLGRTAVGIYRPFCLFFCCDIRLLHSLGCNGSLIYGSYCTFCIVFRFNISHTIPPSYAG